MAQLTIKQILQQALQHHQAGRLQKAEPLYKQILAQQPEHAVAIHHLGVIALQVGRNDLAVDLIRRALAQDPNLAEAHSNLGVALKNQGQLDEAIASYRRAIALKPNYADAHKNLGNALKDKDQLDEAIAAYRKAIALRANYAEAQSNLGSALKDNGQLDEAIAAHRKAIALNPSLVPTHSNLVFAMNYHAGYDARVIAQEQRRWSKQHAEPLGRFIQPHSNERSPDRRLKLGYISPDFRKHPVGLFLLPLLRQHDHGQFEIACYANVLCPDALTHQFQEHADHWRSIVNLSDDQVAQQIRQDEIDILVDLALHTAGNRLLVFARKPAPVQVTFAGYPASTGLTTIDYRLSDPYLDPPGMDESIYSEKTIRLPDSFWCYDPMEGREIPVNPLPALESGVITFGCLNNFCKINKTALILWAQAMHQVENSRLLLLAPEGSPRQRTVDFLSQRGIDPQRIEFAARQPRRDYLKSYHRIDLGLDSFPYNGHTTSLDSFWMGVPIITLVGQTSVSRGGWCQLSNLGLEELVARTPEQFVNISVALAGDLPRLKELRSTLRGRMEQSPLMDAPKFTRNIEEAYRKMWRAWCETASAKG